MLPPSLVRRPGLHHLSLAALRTYRTELLAEETTVSYWRRLVQARLDLLLAERLAPEPAAEADGLLAHLRDVLTDVATTHRRQVLLCLDPGDDAPPLPELTDLWNTGLASAAADDGRALRRLADAERALSGYRKALHRRLDAATGELVSRYSEDPSRCLVALPERRTASGLASA